MFYAHTHTHKEHSDARLLYTSWSSHQIIIHLVSYKNYAISSINSIVISTYAVFKPK